MKKFFLANAAALLLILSPLAQSAPSGKALIYMSPEHFSHEVKLWHFYYSYWFSQGEILEPIALEELKPLFADVGVCESREAADVIVWLIPKIFYNPHMTTFYGSVTARVYSGTTRPVASYRADAQKLGFLDVVPGYQVQSVYRDLMQQIAAKLQADGAVQALRLQGLPSGETYSPCKMVSILPAEK